MKLTSITDSFALRVTRPTKAQKATFYFDKKSTGFGLKVYYNGTKVYGVRIATAGNSAMSPAERRSSRQARILALVSALMARRLIT